MNWRLEILDPLGVFKDYKSLTDPVSELESFSVGGDGDCKEATLTALASGLGINARDIVTLQTDESGVWKNWYAGVATKPGAQRSPDNSSFKLVGLKKRVNETPTNGEVFIGAQDSAAIVRALAQTHLPPEVLYDAALIPDIGFSLTEAKTNYKNLGALFSELAKLNPGFVVPPSGPAYVYNGTTYQIGDYVPPATWGVNADRKLFFGRIAATLALTEAMDGVSVTPKETDAETLVTAVTVIYGTGANGAVAYRYEAAEAAIYGLANKVIPITLPASNTLTPNNAFATEQSSDGGVIWQPYSNTPEYLSDGNDNTMLRSYSDGGGIGLPAFGFGNVYTTFTEPQYVGSVDVKAVAQDGQELYLTYREASGSTQGIPIGVSTIDGPVFLGKTVEAVGVGVVTVSSNDARDVRVSRMIPLASGPEQLKRIAQAEIRLPAIEVADIKLPGGFTEPHTDIELTLRTSEVLTEVAKTFIYRITKKVGVETIIKLGQADPAELSAQAALIQGKADDATITAVTYSNIQGG